VDDGSIYRFTQVEAPEPRSRESLDLGMPALKLSFEVSAPNRSAGKRQTDKGLKTMAECDEGRLVLAALQKMASGI
jgi:hypothetical protein